jgi:hypothetical protein
VRADARTCIAQLHGVLLVSWPDFLFIFTRLATGNSGR